jgi:hypothetical protein
MRSHWPTPAISWPPFMAGPAEPTASPPGGVQRSAARLAVGVARGSNAASATAALKVLRFFIIAPFLWFDVMPPSVIPPRPVSIARPQPSDAGRVRGNFRLVSRQTSEAPLTFSGRLITSCCGEVEGIGAVYWTSRATNASHPTPRCELASGFSVGDYGELRRITITQQLRTSEINLVHRNCCRRNCVSQLFSKDSRAPARASAKERSWRNGAPAATSALTPLSCSLEVSLYDRPWREAVRRPMFNRKPF